MAVYYIRNGGNNSNSGLSDALAWQTLAKVNSFSFAPGDQVLFARNSVWLETLSPAVSGTLANRIIFDSYGSGTLPIFGGKGAVSGWGTSGNWTNQGSNRWSISISGVMMSDIARIRIWLSGTEAMRSSTSAGVNSTLRFYCDGTNLWVYATSNPSTFYSNIERGDSYGAPFVISSKNYLTFNNLEFRGSAWSEVSLTSCNYIIFNGCHIGLYTCASGLWANSCGHCEVMNCTFDTGDRNMDTWEAENEEDGLHLHNGCNNWNIHNNTFKDWGHCCLLLWGDDSGNKVTNINIYDNYFTDVDTDYGSAFTINGFTGGMAGIYIYRNYMYHMSTNNQFVTDGTLWFYDNIIDGTGVGKLNYKANPVGYGIACNAYGSEQGIGQKFYNNTIANCKDGGVILINHAYGMYVYDNEFVNNIFYNNGSDQSGQQIWIGANSPTYGYFVLQNVFKNNLIYSSITTNTIYYGHSPSYPSGTTYTVAMFNAANGTQGDVISNNISGAPVFVSSTDFHLQTSSPAKHAGLTGSTLSVLDYDNVSWGTPPSIGAYEFSSGGGPTYISVMGKINKFSVG
jgi:hypothetical protein